MKREVILADALAGLARLVSGASVRVLDERALGDEQRVYVANHSSHLDFLVLWSALPTKLRRVTRPVAAADYWNRSALRRFLALQVFRAILIDREKVSAHNNPIHIIRAGMANEFSAIVFPEGTRGDGETVGAFKSGIYHLARDNPQLILVPVYIENLNRVLPKGEILPLPLLSSVTLGTPLRLEDEENKSDFLGRLRAAVVALEGSDHP